MKSQPAAIMSSDCLFPLANGREAITRSRSCHAFLFPRPKCLTAFPSNTSKFSLNFPESSPCHWIVKLAGARIRTRSTNFLARSSLRISAASIVLPSPTSSARSIVGATFFVARYVAKIWWGIGSIRALEILDLGSYRCAWLR